MEKDPGLEDFMRNVRQKPEVRLPCADCGELLYLTVTQCPHCKGKSVLKPCAWCHQSMRLFFSLAQQQDYCSECEWKLNREKLRCAHCGKLIPTSEDYVTFARRILHVSCQMDYQKSVPAEAASEEVQTRMQMDAARRQLEQSVARTIAGGAAPQPPEARGCAPVILMALLAAVLLVLRP